MINDTFTNFYLHLNKIQKFNNNSYYIIKKIETVSNKMKNKDYKNIKFDINLFTY